MELMRLRRKIDSRIEPHPFREKDFNITNPVVNEILNHRSEEHTSELQSHSFISYAVFCLKKKNKKNIRKIRYG